MQLHELKGFKHKRRRRVARGGKRGTTSGRGTKGQKSRAGRRIRPALRDLISRIPKRRGFRNKPKKEKALTLPLRRILSRSPARSETIDVRWLQGAGLLSARFHGSVKIVGKTRVGIPLSVKGLSVSEGAKEVIEKAGGSVNQ
jgi:large subunit ribosomal protein L15